MSMHSYCFKLATLPQDVNGYFALRHSIFVEEQGLFEGTDIDPLDAIAYPIVAIADESETSTEAQIRKDTRQLALPLTHHPVLLTHPTFYRSQMSPVLGVVRIYEAEPRLWYGGRLGVHQDYRRAGRIGKGLIYKAVTTANTWGCDRFLATVQLQNVRFFQRQHWHSLEEITVHGLPHHLMEADLNHYPAGNEQRPAAISFVREAS